MARLFDKGLPTTRPADLPLPYSSGAWRDIGAVEQGSRGDDRWAHLCYSTIFKLFKWFSNKSEFELVQKKMIFWCLKNFK
jgi:hypothetical protein